MYDPRIDQSRPLDVIEKMKAHGNYHSTALLMPNGAVWHSGSNKDCLPGASGRDCTVEFLRAVVFLRVAALYRRRYLAFAGETINIETPNAAKIDEVVLVRWLIHSRVQSGSASRQRAVPAVEQDGKSAYRDVAQQFCRAHSRLLFVVHSHGGSRPIGRPLRAYLPQQGQFHARDRSGLVAPSNEIARSFAGQPGEPRSARTRSRFKENWRSRRRRTATVVTQVLGMEAADMEAATGKAPDTLEVDTLEATERGVGMAEQDTITGAAGHGGAGHDHGGSTGHGGAGHDHGAAQDS